MFSQGVFDFDRHDRITVAFDDVGLCTEVIDVPFSVHTTKVASQIVAATKPETSARRFGCVEITGEPMERRFLGIDRDLATLASRRLIAVRAENYDTEAWDSLPDGTGEPTML